MMGNITTGITSPIIATAGSGGGGGGLPVTDGLVFHLSGANVGSTPQQWDDLSGLGNHWFNSTPANFPVYQSGDDSMLFDGVNSELFGPSLASLTEGEIFIRLKSNSAGTLWIFSNVNDGWYPLGTDIYEGWGSTVRKGPLPFTEDITAYHTYNCFSAANDYGLAHNGTPFFTTTTNTVNFQSAPSIGNGAAGRVSINVKEIVMFDSKRTTEERALMHTYMAGL